MTIADLVLFSIPSAALVLTVVALVAWVGELTLTADTTDLQQTGTLFILGTTLTTVLYLIVMHGREWCVAWLTISAVIGFWTGIGWCVEQAVRRVRAAALAARLRAERLQAEAEALAQETEEVPPPPGCAQ